jgi:Spy/CpxP family protein refolding chaperone
LDKLLISLLCVFLLAISTAAGAQNKSAGEPTPAEWRMKIQADQKGIVERSMKLTPDEAAKFWPIYESFQRELERPQREYRQAVLDYVATENSLTDANAKRLVDQVLAASVEEARLRQKYFKKFAGVLPAKKAARYMQIDNKMQAVLRYETAAALPLAQ